MGAPLRSLEMFAALSRGMSQRVAPWAKVPVVAIPLPWTPARFCGDERAILPQDLFLRQRLGSATVSRRARKFARELTCFSTTSAVGAARCGREDRAEWLSKARCSR